MIKYLGLVGWLVLLPLLAADESADVDLAISYQREALSNALRCLETIRGDDYRIALTRIWVAENLGYFGDSAGAVRLLKASNPHYLIPYGCVETSLILLGHGQNHAVREMISLGLDLLPFAAGRGAELVQFQLLKLATVVGDVGSERRAWAAEALTKTDLRPAYADFIQDWKPGFWSRILDWWKPDRHWQNLRAGASREEEIAWTAERAVDMFTALLLLKEAESRVRRDLPYPSSWITFSEAGVASAPVSTRPAALQTELAKLAELEKRPAEALALVYRTGGMLSGWAPQMTGLYRIERDLALVLSGLSAPAAARAEFSERLIRRVEVAQKQLDAYEQMLQFPFLAESFHILGFEEKAQELWKTTAELCAANQNPESQSIGLTRIWMSYARANTWPAKETEALLAKIEKKLPEEYAKVNF